MDYKCPKCRSDNIQRLAIVYESGLSTISANSTGTATGYVHNESVNLVTTTSTTGVSQTAASQRAAPPTKYSYFIPLLTIFVICSFCSIYFHANHLAQPLITIGWFGCSAWWIRFAFQYNKYEWVKLKAHWDNSFLCNRCNEIFCVGDGDSFAPR